MKLVFYTNVMNHHQLSLADALNSQPEVDFSFITTTSGLSKERRNLGYPDLNRSRDYIICATGKPENKEKADNATSQADILIVGAADRSVYHKHELKGKPLFMYCERLYRTPLKKLEMIPRMILYYFKHKRFKNKYLLCASAFTSGDYYKTRTFVNKAYKWGYFPETVSYDIDSLLSRKKGDKIKIMWCGRYLELKHPEAPVILAEYLKNKGYSFEINMVGAGGLMSAVAKMIVDKNLTDCVHICGSMDTQMVREEMENSNIFLFTSDRNEGWGAVLNEAMNSGCAVVASHEIGSVPYLIKDQENGLVFEDQNWNSLCKKVEMLINDSELREKLGVAAYNTISNTWNSRVAAERFLVLADCLKNGKETPYTDGPCSRAEVLFDDWYLD